MGMTARVSRLTVALATAGAATVAFSGALPGSAAPPPESGQDGQKLAKAFETAADRYDVPRDLLVGLGYAETHLDGHDGQPSASGGYGVMHLVDNPKNRTLVEAARLTGLSTAELRTDPAANVAGAAAVLGSYADRAGLKGSARTDVARWYSVVAGYAHAASSATARLYADEVYRILGRGVSAEGGAVRVPARSVQPQRGAYAKVAPLGTAAVDYPDARWVAASPSNYQVASRGSDAITAVVIHVTQGSYAGTISWFQNPSAQVSAHYVVRSNDGEVTQMVREKDIAWHARSGNPYSVGIEHEGFVDDASWFTDAMYRSSAALTRNIADRNGIPKDRQHIVGHSEVPGNDHTDPGPNWDWDYYMELVGGGTGDPTNFTTWGNGVNVRADALLSAPVVTTLAGPTRVFVECQKQGDTVTVGEYTNNWWSKLRDQNGFITNIYIDHPDQQLPGVPIC